MSVTVCADPVGVAGPQLQLTQHVLANQDFTHEAVCHILSFLQAGP